MARYSGPSRRRQVHPWKVAAEQLDFARHRLRRRSASAGWPAV